MIPLVVFLIHSGSRKNKMRNVGLLFIPVVLIPLLWPAQNVFTGSFDNWINGVLAQTQRQGEGIAAVFWPFLTVDPLLLALGILGLGFAVLKKDPFILLWAGPFLTFLWLIGYVQYFHVLPVLAVFCISAALWLDYVIIKIGRRLVRHGIVASVAAFGLVSTTLLITTNVTSSQFEATAFALSIADNDTTIIANPVYSWPYDLVFHMPYALNDYREVLYYPVPTDKVVLISDLHLQGSIHEEEIREVLDSTTSVRIFHGNATNYDANSYPYTSLRLNYQGNIIDVRQKVP
jgi:hypothetical protein